VADVRAVVEALVVAAAEAEISVGVEVAVGAAGVDEAAGDVNSIPW